MYRTFLLCLLILPALLPARAQEPAAELIRKVKSKLDQVTSYEADGLMKTNVSFLKVPQAHVKIYFKRPDKFRVKNEQGISLVPKTISSISLNSLVEGNFSVLDAGTERVNGHVLRVIKLLPSDETQEIVLSTLYIDEKNLLVEKTRTTTRENGTYEVDLTYGKYSAYALPDRVVCRFNSKDYKLPKGITFDYDDGTKKKPEDSATGSKGEVQIIYNSYQVNKIIPDTVF
jgi:outer membrane lipoprotein-sorting protein